MSERNECLGFLIGEYPGLGPIARFVHEDGSECVRPVPKDSGLLVGSVFRVVGGLCEHTVVPFPVAEEQIDPALVERAKIPPKLVSTGPRPQPKTFAEFVPNMLDGEIENEDDLAELHEAMRSNRTTVVSDLVRSGPPTNPFSSGFDPRSAPAEPKSKKPRSKFDE